MGLSSSIGLAMATGGLDIILCVLPQDKVVTYGIPFLRWTIETGIPTWEKKKWDIFWESYFMKQWIPILPSWNVRQDNGSILPMVNRTNNALECYNKRFNCLFDKQPTLIKFVQTVKKETQFQAEKLQDIWAGKRVEVHRESAWVPEISLTYYNFKESLVTPAKTIKALLTKPAEKRGKKNKK